LSNKLGLFAFDTVPMFCVLQSSLHSLWAWRYCSTNLSLLNYSPSDAFLTFPFPVPLAEQSRWQPQGLIDIGTSYLELRSKIMRTSEHGLTTLYNRFHDPLETHADIERLRELQVALDHNVLKSYGWESLKLVHDFVTTSQGQRFTVEPLRQDELLQRLLVCNQQECAYSIKGSRKLRKIPKKPETDGKEPRLFDMGGEHVEGGW